MFKIVLYFYYPDKPNTPVIYNYEGSLDGAMQRADKIATDKKVRIKIGRNSWTKPEPIWKAERLNGNWY